LTKTLIFNCIINSVTKMNLFSTWVKSYFFPWFAKRWWDVIS